jgi:hypothetical protein
MEALLCANVSALNTKLSTELKGVSEKLAKLNYCGSEAAYRTVIVNSASRILLVGK